MRQLLGHGNGAFSLVGFFHGNQLRLDLHTSAKHLLHTIDDHKIAMVETFTDHLEIIHLTASSDLPGRNPILFIHHVDETTVLIGQHRLAVDQQCLVQLGHGHFHTGKLAGFNQAVRVVEHGTVLQGAGPRIQVIVDEIQLALVLTCLLYTSDAADE